MKRSEAREMAFQIIFESSFKEDTAEELLTLAAELRSPPPDDFVKLLVLLTLDHLWELDTRLQPFLKGWKLERIPRVTHQIMRLAACEIDYVSDVPVSVTINEAVELAKKYATEEDVSYLNGVLGSYVRSKKNAEETQ